MAISFLLAKILGLYLLFLGLGIIINRKEMHDIVRGFLHDKPLYFLTSIATLTLGAILISTHSIWTSFWKGVISLIGWLIFIKGVTRMIIPQDKYIKWLEGWNLDQNKYLFAGIVTTVIGIYLTYIGFAF